MEIIYYIVNASAANEHPPGNVGCKSEWKLRQLFPTMKIFYCLYKDFRGFEHNTEWK